MHVCNTQVVHCVQDSDRDVRWAVMEAVRYYLGFNLTPGIGPARLSRLIEYFGSVRAAWEAPASALAATGLDARTCEALMALRARLDLDAELERVWRAGASLLCLEDADYPALLREIPQPPPLIYIRGSLAVCDDWAVAVVGTRRPTSYGKEAAKRITGELAAAGVTIVSGLAIGVDGVAHEAALDAGGRTIAVLGCGVDVAYPDRHRDLVTRIVHQGALVSEYPIGTVPAPLNFPPRNRLISGLTRGTLVVEAGARSGALITVEFALEQGRDVFAVPGSIFSRFSEGTNRLIRDGAGLVSGAGDILTALNLTAVPEQQALQFDVPDDPAEQIVLAGLDHEPRHIDEIGRTGGLAAAAVAAALAMLELKGLVRQAAPMVYVRVG